ncbi:uncharacterized protein RSE6_02123 [Rhynchosporium secalis]|uniref:Secreted protein n=1 Tax=Rhynchosporium secalis TaxID=38038 RepID=A0A1E1LZG9_RHYSE|nr:uncharacterized protein RSE6_02123 [Rhynchosporium secalis]
MMMLVLMLMLMLRCQAQAKSSAPFAPRAGSGCPNKANNRRVPASSIIVLIFRSGTLHRGDGGRSAIEGNEWVEEEPSQKPCRNCLWQDSLDIHP